jgi:hypothetical protein
MKFNWPFAFTWFVLVPVLDAGFVYLLYRAI